MQLLMATFALLSFTQALTQYDILCEKNITCSDGEPHFMCTSQEPQCNPFKILHLGADQINSFLLGHNGIRNRVAKQYRIANMNIVHWSIDLQLMAERFLKKCRLKRDFCQHVGPPELHVNENYLFYQGIVSNKWPARLVRKWFNEFGYRQSWQNFFKNRPSRDVGNFSNMIFPLVQLIGCNAAHFPSGHYMFVCYYWPRTRRKYKEAFLFGEPCSQCNPKVPACSRVFKGLCGIDIEISKAISLRSTKFSRLVGILLMLILCICASFRIDFKL